MKLLLSISALCLLLVFTQSCTKDNPDVPVTDTLVIHHVDTLYNIDTVYITHPTSILGLWIGTYDITGGSEAGKTGFYYSFELHKDSTIQMSGVGSDGLTYYGIGTWSLDKTAFSAHFTTTNLSQAGVAQSAIGIYDSTNSKLSGTVTNDLGGSYKQVFKLEKVQ